MYTDFFSDDVSIDIVIGMDPYLSSQLGFVSTYLKTTSWKKIIFFISLKDNINYYDKLISCLWELYIKTHHGLEL